MLYIKIMLDDYVLTKNESRRESLSMSHNRTDNINDFKKILILMMIIMKQETRFNEAKKIYLCYATIDFWKIDSEDERQIFMNVETNDHINGK